MSETPDSAGSTASTGSDYRTSCVERFLRYVTFDTQSTETSETYPSTAKQLDLLRHLVDELKALGLGDAAIDEYGYVMATIPATTKKIGRAGHRLHRPRGHLARDERRRRQADRPPRLPGAGPGAAGRPHRRAAPAGRSPISASGSATTSSPPRAPRCWAPTTRPAWPRSWPPPSTCSRTPRSPTARSASASRPTRRWAPAPSTSTSRSSAPNTPTPWTAAPAARSRCESFSADAMTITFQGLQHASRLRQGEDGQLDQGRRRLHLPPAQGRPVAGDHGRLRGVRPPLRAQRRASSRPRSSC